MRTSAGAGRRAGQLGRGSPAPTPTGPGPPFNTLPAQVAGDVCDLLAAAGCWDHLLQLLVAGSAALRPGAAGPAAAMGAPPAGGAKGGQLALPQALPLHAVCCLVPAVIAACAAAPAGGGERPAGAKQALAFASGPLLAQAMAAVTGPDAPAGRAVLRSVLPAVVGSARSLGQRAELGALRSVWAACTGMLAEPRQRRYRTVNMYSDLKVSDVPFI